MPVFRPLIGMDKEEVVADAQRLGTYEVSIRPDEDCCRLFVPAHPLTRTTPAEVAAAEASLPIADLVDQAVEAVVVERFSWPVVQSRFPRKGSAIAEASSITKTQRREDAPRN
jgi:thiamine biosynthesis protein ThiI